MSQFKVVITDYEFKDLQIEEEVLAQLDVEFVKGQCKTEQEILDLVTDADGIITQYAPINFNVIKHLKKCKIISKYGVGVNTIDVTAANARNICVANVPDYGYEEVANHALALLLTYSRKIVLLNQKVKKGIWDFKAGTPISRLSGQTLGVLGFGRISKNLIQKAIPFGLNIKVYDPYVSEKEIKEIGAVPAKLDNLFKESDYISVHVPLTRETENIIHKDNLNLMKNNAVIINAARGGIINEEDLIEALNNKVIAGAALDVLTREPIDSNHPLIYMDNVILTPHSAWYSEESMLELRTKTAQNIVDVFKGKQPDNVVNTESIMSCTVSVKYKKWDVSV